MPAGGVVHLYPSISSHSCGSTIIEDRRVEDTAVEAGSETMYRTIYTSEKEAKVNDNRQTIFVNVTLDASRVLPGSETFNPAEM